MIQKETKEIPVHYYDRADLQEMIQAHKLWLDSNRQTGSRFRLEHCDVNDFEGFGEQNLKQSRFSHVNFYYCNFTGTNFRDSTFYNCRFYNCTFFDTEMKYASLDDTTPFSNCTGVLSLEGADGYKMLAFQHADEPRFLAGCRYFTKEEAFEHWSVEHPSVLDDDGRHCRIAVAAVNALLVLGQLQGWKGCEPVYVGLRGVRSTQAHSEEDE